MSAGGASTTVRAHGCLVIQAAAWHRGSMRWGLVWVSTLVVLVAASAAKADVVFEPSDPCPQGSKRITDHCRSWCAAVECSADAQCEPRRAPKSSKRVQHSCREAGLCVEDERGKSCGGLSGGGPMTRRIASGPCKTDGDCQRPATCRVASRCVPSGPGDALDIPPPKASCSCAWVGATPRPATWPPAMALALAATLGLGLRRRLRR